MTRDARPGWLAVLLSGGGIDVGQDGEENIEQRGLAQAGGANEELGFGGSGACAALLWSENAGILMPTAFEAHLKTTHTHQTRTHTHTTAHADTSASPRHQNNVLGTTTQCIHHTQYLLCSGVFLEVPRNPQRTRWPPNCPTFTSQLPVPEAPAPIIQFNERAVANTLGQRLCRARLVRGEDAEDGSNSPDEAIPVCCS